MPFVLPVCSKNPGRGLQILERTLLGRGKDVPGVRRRNTEGVRRKGRACQLGSWESPRKRYRNKLQEGSALFPLSDNQCFCIFFFFFCTEFQGILHGSALAEALDISNLRSALITVKLRAHPPLIRECLTIESNRETHLPLDEGFLRVKIGLAVTKPALSCHFWGCVGRGFLSLLQPTWTPPPPLGMSSFRVCASLPLLKPSSALNFSQIT